MRLNDEKDGTMAQCEKIAKAFQCSAAIVFSTNDAFAKYLSAMLQSIIDNSCCKNFYDIVILTSDMSDSTFEKLSSMIRKYKNFSLRRFEVSEIIEDYAFFTENVSRLSQETYYRLLIPELFRDYERVIYLDGDMIARVDIAELYDIPFEGNSLISSRDMNGVMYCHSDYEDGIERAQYRKNLMAPNDPNDYVIAGLLVFNINQVKKYSAEELLTLAASREWPQHDQDVVNYLFSGKTKLLHAKWDFLHEINRHHIGYMPKELQKEYYEAEANPYIVHFGGNRKPWTSWYVQNDLLFWRAISKTPFFEEVFFGMKWKIEYKAYVVKHLFRDEFNNYDKDNKLLFSFLGKEIGDYNQTVSIHFCSIHDGVFELEGVLPKVGLKNSDDLRVYLRSAQGIFSSLESNLYSKWYREEGDLKWEGLAFRFLIPLTEVLAEDSFALFYSVNGRYYQSMNFSFGRHCAIGDELHSSYQYADGKILTFDRSLFLLKNLSDDTAKIREAEFLEELSYWKCYEETKKLRMEIMQTENPIWLFTDSVGVLRGSARSLFDYACEHSVEWGVVPILVVDSGSLKNPPFNVEESMAYGSAYILRDSIEHKKLYIKCEYCFTSSMFLGEFDPFFENYSPYRDLVHSKKIVYVPHTESLTDISGWLNRSEFNPWLLTTFSDRDHASIIDNPKYSLEDSCVKQVGIPRYDDLCEEQAKNIVVFPAKRKYLMRNIGKHGEKANWVTKGDFRTSDFFLFYNSLINDSRLLAKARETGYKIRVVYYREMANCVKYFDCESELVDFCPFEEYETIMPSAKLFITDYSSLTTDAAALQRPILYARFFELEALFDEYPFGRPVVDIKEEGLGPVLASEDEVVLAAISCMELDCGLTAKYPERLERIYPRECFKSSCARVFCAVEEHERECCLAGRSSFTLVGDGEFVPVPTLGSEPVLTQNERKQKLSKACKAIGLPHNFDRIKQNKNRSSYCWGTEIDTALPIEKGPKVVLLSRAAECLHAPSFVDCKISDWCLLFLSFLAYKAFGSVPCDALAWNETVPRWRFGKGWRVVAEGTKYHDYQIGDVVSFDNGQTAIVYDLVEGSVSLIQAQVSGGICVVNIGGLSQAPFAWKSTRISRLPRVNWVIRKIYQ